MEIQADGLLAEIEDGRQRALSQMEVVAIGTPLYAYHNGRASAYYHAGVLVIAAGLKKATGGE